MQDLINKFTLDRIQKSGAVFNLEKLNFLNKYYISLKSKGDLVKEVLDYALEFGFLKVEEGSGNLIFLNNNKSASPSQFEKYIQTERTRISKYPEFFKDNFLFSDLEYTDKDLY